jgi:hypothetical protein
LDGETIDASMVAKFTAAAWEECTTSARESAEYREKK